MSFPLAFVWGVAASSFQIEGAAESRGESVWDRFCRRPGAVYGGHTGDVACDHVRRYQEDVGLMAALGVHAYRFSIAWPRVLPAGSGPVSERGLDFYDRLVDELLAAGITPYATLFHWDLPYALYARGGWLNRDSAEWFGAYADLVARRLGDRVRHWMPLNEPGVVVELGHNWGLHAPGDRLQLSQLLEVNHHLLLAHGRATQAIRAAAPGALVGAVEAVTPGLPASQRPADLAAARRQTVGLTEASTLACALRLDPMLLGRYPFEELAALDLDLPPAFLADLDAIARPLDFIGLNIYTGTPVEMGDDGRPRQLPFPPGHPITAIQWNVAPEALYWGPRFVAERYGLPIYITENGMAAHDWPAADGSVHDAQRIAFLEAYLGCLGRAIQDGADVRGYFQWSLLDNFEWAEGYRQRFGLVYVDFATQKRTLKASARWYADVIRANGASLAPAAATPRDAGAPLLAQPV